MSAGDGGTVVVLGIVPGNFVRMLKGDPVLVDLQPLLADSHEAGSQTLTVMLMGGQDEQAIADQLLKHGIGLPPNAIAELDQVKAEYEATGVDPSSGMTAMHIKSEEIESYRSWLWNEIEAAAFTAGPPEGLVKLLDGLIAVCQGAPSSGGE